MTSIRVEHTDGSTETLEHLASQYIREFGKIDIGRLFTSRAEVNGISLTENEDEVFLVDDGGSDIFGGVLKDIERDGPKVELVVDSFERYAADAEPTAQGETYQNVADTTVVNDAITAISDLSAGTVSNVKSGLSFVFPTTSQAKKIRTVEEATPAEVQYNADKTVDYKNRLGTDRSASLTISPGNQNLDGKMKVMRKGGGKNVTHLRMLGAGEGKHQIVANIVPSADGTSYENKTTYSSSWSSGDRKVWDTYINKDLTDADTLGEQGLTKIAELNDEYIEIEATIKGVDVVLGDTVHVQKPKDGIDQDLRIVEWTRREDKKGLRYECVLSNRVKAREKADEKDRKDVQRYNKAFEGVPVQMQAGGNRMPVDGTHNWELEFYYPSEVVQELRAQVNVKGLGYRAYSKGAAGGGDHSHSVDVTHPSHTHDVTHPSHAHDVTHPSHDHFVSLTSTESNNAHGDPVAASGDNISLASDTGGSWSQVESISAFNYEIGFVHVHVTSSDAVVEVRARDSSTTSVTDTSGDFTPNSTGTALVGTQGSGQSSSATLAVPDDWGTVDVDYKTDSAPNCNIHVAWIFIDQHDHNISGTTSDTALGTTETSTTALGTTETSSAALGTTSSETSDASGPHTHDPDPGIIDFPEYPSNCDILVNGQSVGTAFGDGTGPFEQTADIAGLLNEGQWNTIEVTSDTLGHIQAHVDVDVYRQILGDG